MKYRFFILILLVFLLLSVSFFLMFTNSTNIKKDIETGELTYSCHCGWINWGHAIPTDVKGLIAQIVNDSLGAGTKEISYSQKMKVDLIGDSKVVTEVSRTYSISNKLTEEERNIIAFAIFQETSEHFEQLQGSFPYSIHTGSHNSSFKDGDLMGDKIAFYRALYGYSKADIENLCKPVPTIKSLNLFEEGKYKNNYTWLPTLYLPEGQFPKELDSIALDKNLINKNLTFIDESRRTYLEF